MLVIRRHLQSIAFMLLVLIVFSFWKSGHNFFWRDEWNFLSDFRVLSLSFFFEPFNGHIKPVFKFFYWCELKLFGVNGSLYAYTNLLVFTGALFFLFKMLHYITFFNKTYDKRSWLYVVIPVLIAATHPINFNHLLWSFQVSQSLFMMFQIGSIYYFVRFINEKNATCLTLSILFIILQNYSFGNGIFFPLCFTGFSILFIKDTIKKKAQMTAVFFFLFFSFFSIQVFFGPQMSQINDLLPGIISIARSFLFMLDLNVVRTFFITDFPTYKFKVIGVTVFVIMLLIGLKNKRNDKSMMWIYASWFITNSMSIPIARPNIVQLQTVPHYYSVMAIIPLLLLTAECLFDKRIFISMPQKITLVVFLCLVFFLIDNRMVAVFTNRNLRNELALLKAIRDNEAYHPLDDPFFTSGAIRIKDPGNIYLYWKHQTLYRVDPVLSISESK